MLVGGWSPVADTCLGSPTAQAEGCSTLWEAAFAAIAKLNGESNSIYQLGVVQIVSAKSQVVAGMKYEIRMQVAQSTNCKQVTGATNSLYMGGEHSACSVDSNTAAEYVAVVVSTPWMQPPLDVVSIEPAPTSLLMPGPVMFPSTSTAEQKTWTQEEVQQRCGDNSMVICMLLPTCSHAEFRVSVNGCYSCVDPSTCPSENAALEEQAAIATTQLAPENLGTNMLRQPQELKADSGALAVSSSGHSMATMFFALSAVGLVAVGLMVVASRRREQYGSISSMADAQPTASAPDL
jgi:hypothetical protein